MRTEKALRYLPLIWVGLCSHAALANTTPQPVPFTQDWTNIGLITTTDNWNNVPGVIGYRGDGLAGGTGVNPQTILADGSGTPVNVLANQTNPNTLTTGGVAEFHITNPVVALRLQEHALGGLDEHVQRDERGGEAADLDESKCLHYSELPD